ncbi:MAG: hypothetical protein JWR22_2023 [Herminiimonas sp.]|nr:hypothetical protein [Herminiimonas sp.]
MVAPRITPARTTPLRITPTVDVQPTQHHCATPRILGRAAVAVAALLAACATQLPTPGMPQPSPAFPAIPSIMGPSTQDVLRNIVTAQDRLYRVAGPLLVRNTDLCKGNARNLLGFTAKNRYSWGTELSDAAAPLYGVDESLQVMGVLAGSGAARVGVRRGDRLVSAEGKTFAQGQSAERQAAIILVPMVKTKNSIKLVVKRDGAELPLTVPLTRACDYSIELGNADNVNAYNDGRRVMITRGMMRFAQTDDELAYVLAKEMAHNSLSHATRQNMSGTVADVIDNLMRVHPDLTAMSGASGIRPTPQELDAAADTLALYMVARAGYNVDGEIGFWTRLATQYPASVLNGYTAIHPATAYRMDVMRTIVADVKSKQAARQALAP